MLMGLILYVFQNQSINSGKEKPEKNGMLRNSITVGVKCICISRELEENGKASHRTEILLRSTTAH
jgi:hypothetical protein